MFHPKDRCHSYNSCRNDSCCGLRLCFSFLQTINYTAFSFLFILFLVAMQPAFAEGTKQIMTNPIHNGRIFFEYDFGRFATYGCDPQDRLNIRIANGGEKIYYGFGASISGSLQTVYDVTYRIIDPDGLLVVNEKLQPMPGENGYISTYQQAVSGPEQFNSSGYKPLSYTCNKVGDYYIEFDSPDLSWGDRREFTYFDITVVSNENKPVDGRIWSKAWIFTVSEKGGDGYANPFYGKMYMYTDDGIVSSVDFNGMKPFVFSLSANGTGVSNTGNPILDRRSINFKSTYPQYKVFLNDPDSLVFPSGSFGYLTAPTEIIGEEPPYCINVFASKPGAIEVLINFNGQPGYQGGSRDVLIAKNVDGGSSCINWDGKDGLGKEIPLCSAPVGFYITYIGGLTHMPIYDVETNENGFIIDLVRPKNPNSHLALYWDDSYFPNYSEPPSEGCDGATGCHKFGYFFGDERTINTWWYSTSEVSDSLFHFNYNVSLDSINVKNQNCSNIVNGEIEIYASKGTPPFHYSLDGLSYQTSPTFKNLPGNSYDIYVRDQNDCIEAEQRNLALNTTILADFELEQINAYNFFDFTFTGEGANYYQWTFGDGEWSDKTNPTHQYIEDSVYIIKLLAESGFPDYCKDSITKSLEVYPPLQVFAPTAFSPNGDNLNDTFEIFGTGIHAFQIYIFSSDGTELFFSDNLENQWTGFWQNELLRTGVYAYVISVKDRHGITHQKKGTVTLLW